MTMTPAPRAPLMSATVSPTATVCSRGQVSGSLPGEIDQLGALLGVAAEGSLPRRKQVIEPDQLHPRSRDRLRVAGEEGAMLDLRDRLSRPSEARQSLVSASASSSR